MQNFWERDQVVQPQRPAGRFIPGVARPPAPPSAAEQERLELARRADARAQREHEIRMARTEGGRVLPEAANRRLGDGTSSLQALDRALSNFNEDFTGNYTRLSGAIESELEGRGWAGTPGQRDWWSDVYATDNIARNALFGASLTEGEKASWERTTVNPTMAPEQIRANLSRRREIADAALRRLARTYRANGYNEDAIRESLGEVENLLDEAPTPADAPAPVGGASDPQAPQPGGTLAFLDDAVPPQDQGPTPAQSQFRARLQAAFNDGTIRDFASYQAFSRQQARDLGLDPEVAARGATPEAVREAVLGARRGRIGVDLVGTPAPAAPPGPPAERAVSPTELMVNEAVAANMPGLAPLSAAAGAIFGREGGDAFRRGVVDVPTFGLSDEAAAGFRASMGQGDYDSNVARERGINSFDEQNNFGARLTGQFAGGALLPFNPAAGLAPMAARSGAYGGAYGFGSGEGGNRGANALIGAGIGAAVPVALRGAGAGFNALRGSGAPVVTPEAQAIARAADQEGVTISRPIVDPTARGRMRNLQATFGSGAPIDDSLAATGKGIEDRAGQLGASGTAEDPAVMGQRIQDAAQNFITRSGGTRTRLYDRAAELAGDNPVRGQEAVRVIDEQIAELAPNEAVNRPQIEYLQQLRSTFVNENGELTPRNVAGIRDLRTEMRGHLSQRNLTMSGAERRVNLVLQAARRDIERDLGASAPAAVRAYQRADAFNARRADEIKQVVQRVIGRRDDNLSGEAVMARVRTMAGPRGDSARLERLWSKLAPEDAADAAATIAATAGRKTPEEEFTPGAFIAWSRGLSPRARELMFGADGARSIGNLQTLSRALVDTRSKLNNSGSGVVRNYAATIREFFSGGLPGAAIGLLAGAGAYTGAAVGAGAGAALSAGGIVLRNLSARSLMSPDMSRWLAAAPRMTTPRAIRRHIGRLSAVAARDPAIAQEATGLRQALLRAVNDNYGTPAAASNPEENQDQQRR